MEHWANALNQPTGGGPGDARPGRSPTIGCRTSTPTSTTWAWSTDGYVEPDGYDQVVFRGDVKRREFIAFWLGGGRVLAGMNVNIWDANDMIQALVRSGRTVDPDRLADPERAPG